ncbi:MAG: carbohydrate binding domain-containing protein, partial [Ktedonobacteraceae bacterium]
GNGFADDFVLSGPGGSSTQTQTQTNTPTPTATSTSTPTPTPTPTGQPTPTPTGGNLVSNPGFETGNLSGWTCQGGDTVASSPVHSGSFALAVMPTSSTTGECDQTISVQPGHTYTLTAFVNGPFAYLGMQNGGSIWTSSGSYTQLSVTLTTGASQTSIVIFVHGWYGQSTVNFDDVTLS